MNTTELVDRVSQHTGMAKDGVRKVLDAVLGAIADAANTGRPVALAGFGQFKVQARPARQGRNPATGREHRDCRLAEAGIHRRQAATG